MDGKSLHFNGFQRITHSGEEPLFRHRDPLRRRPSGSSRCGCPGCERTPIEGRGRGKGVEKIR